MAGADDLGDLAEQMGEDFGFGFASDEDDPNKPPKPERLVLTEELDLRTSSSMAFKFQRQGQFLKKLVLQVTPMEKGKDPDAVMAAFSSDTKGAREVNASDPIDDTSIKVGALLPDTEYVARLVATNRNGTVEGAVAGPFQTLEYCPEIGQASGFMLKVPDVKKMGTLRRMSFKRKPPMRVFATLEGQMFIVFDKPEGKEIERIELRKVKVVAAESDNNILTIDEAVFEVQSSDPKITNAEKTQTWLQRLRAAQANHSEFGGQAKTSIMF